MFTQMLHKSSKIVENVQSSQPFSEAKLLKQWPNDTNRVVW